MIQAFRRTSDGEFSPWQLCTRFDIPDRENSSATYLTRWRIIQTPWFGIYLHCIRTIDKDDALHDHPWPFVSIILRGGYLEERPTHAKRRGFLSIAFRKATDLHRIVMLTRTPTWTLVFAGPRKRRWGFQTENGWVNYREYLKLDEAER
jgi:hypothetical protein